jgi:hypothetical protein
MGDAVEVRFDWNWYFIRILLKPIFPYQISSIETDFYYWFKLFIFRFDFLGIRLTTHSTIFYFFLRST